MLFFISVQSLSHVWLCNPMTHSTPGLAVYHQLPESTQTHVCWVGDANQLSHTLSSPSPPAFNLSQHHSLFKWVSSSYRWPKYSCFSFNISPSNEHPGLIFLGWTGWISFQSKRLSRVFSNTTFKSTNSSVLSFLHSPTLTSIHDHWEMVHLD